MQFKATGVFKRSYLSTIFIVCLSLCFPACPEGLTSIVSGGGLSPVSVDGNNISSENAGSSVDVSGTTDSGGTEATDPTDAGTTNVVPEGTSLPISYFTERTLAFAGDGDENIPVVASAGATDCTTSCQVALSSSSLTDSAWLMFSKNSSRYSAFSSMKNIFISDAYADSTTDICSQSGVTCCPVNTDGSFGPCYLPLTDQSVSEVHVAIVAADGALSDDTTETVHSNLKWLASAPTDVVAVGDEVYTITDGVAVQLAENDDGTMLVQGDYTDGYTNFTTTGTKLSYSSTDSLMGVMSDSGIELFNVDGGVVSNSGETGCAATSTAVPSVMKTLNDIIYCGKTETVAVDEAYLHYATTIANSSYGRHHDIKIIAPEDGLGLVQVLGFDQKEVDDIKWTVVVFNDGENIRIRAVKEDGVYDSSWRIGGSVWKPLTDITIKDFVFYHSQADSSEDSRFAILDSQNNKVWLGKVNVDSGTFDMSDSNVVSVGSNPVAMKLYGDRLFVLNVGDQTVSVIRLFNADGTTPRETPFVSATVSLPDFITGKTISLAPSTFIVNADHLIIGDAATKALLVVDRSAISETTLADEVASVIEEVAPSSVPISGDSTAETSTTVDADGDGSDSTLDCNDGDATVYPGATETCGDSIDQDCDGSDTACSSGGSGRGGHS